MTDDQTGRTTDEDGEAWAVESMKPSKTAVSGRWYAANTASRFAARRCAKA